MDNHTAWSAHSESERGALLRFYFGDIDGRVKGSQNKTLRVKLGIFKDEEGLGDDYTALSHPSIDEVKKFKAVIFTQYRDYLDSLFGVTFKRPITDEQIGILAGNNVNLEHNRGAAFVESAGITGVGNESRETGVDRNTFERNNKTKAVTAPDKFITDADNDLKKIDVASLKIYRESFQKYFQEYQMPAEEAKKKAMIDKDVYYGLLKKQHDQIFTTDLFKQAKKRLYKNVV